MHDKGLTKLIEECGELIQIAAKKAAYIHTDEHPDGAGSMNERLEEEIADVMAAIEFVMEKFNLDERKVFPRATKKLERFQHWDTQPDGQHT